MNKCVLLGIATLLAALLYACPADGGSTSGSSDPGINIEKEIKEKDPALVYKADTNESAQALFSRGDLDNPYLFSFEVSTVKNIEAITGEITITGGDTVLYEETRGTQTAFDFNAHTDYQTYKTTEGMYTLDMGTFSGAASIDAVTADPSYDGTTYIVGVGPSEDNPIDYDTLTDDFSINVKLLHAGEVLKEETVQISKAGRYDVTTWRDLQRISDDLKGSYEVKNDIIFPELGTYGYDNFEPIGYGENEITGPYFEGAFDGNNHKIEGLYIRYKNMYKTGVIGLFSLVRNATIENITIYHRGIYGVAEVGGLIGYLGPASIVRNAHVYSMNGEAITGPLWTGGLIGHGTIIGHETLAQGEFSDKKPQIIDSSAHTDVRGEHKGYYYMGNEGSLGGLIGAIRHAFVRNSHATGNVYGKVDIGGLIGGADSVSITESYATGDVEGETNVGGLVGNSYGEKSDITGYATGDVVGNRNVGGMVGNIRGLMTIIGYSTGGVEGCDNVGGMTGRVEWRRNRGAQPIIMTGYSLGDIVGCEKTGGLVGGIDFTYDWHKDGAGETAHIVNGYARGKVSVAGSSVSSDIGLFMGYVYDKTRGKFDGYVASTTSKFTNVKENQVTGLNGNRITISGVNDANYKKKFDGFAFGKEVGQWTWEGKGKWPAINIGGKTPTADQPITTSSYTP